MQHTLELMRSLELEGPSENHGMGKVDKPQSSSCSWYAGNALSCGKGMTLTQEQCAATLASPRRLFVIAKALFPTVASNPAAVTTGKGKGIGLNKILLTKAVDCNASPKTEPTGSCTC